jgi:hypothetical protein
MCAFISIFSLRKHRSGEKINSEKLLVHTAPHPADKHGNPSSRINKIDEEIISLLKIGVVFQHVYLII